MANSLHLEDTCPLHNWYNCLSPIVHNFCIEGLNIECSMSVESQASTHPHITNMGDRCCVGICILGKVGDCSLWGCSSCLGSIFVGALDSGCHLDTPDNFANCTSKAQTPSEKA